ncbi:MAG TPA: DUF6600 domain-containing protein [Thermoanaerobaculia bacterium]|jgi:hypothetical protein|nr:DUF6600 domain-containing protein [Thermoanaerobaculia bacterium]
MRKSTLLFLAAAALAALPLSARDRSHSYITYDDGGTTIRQSEDGRDVDARVNMPVFPGDEVTTGRRGRVEIRMADGNVIALDRSTSVEFKSILDSYDGDSEQTVVELKYGHVAIQRDDETRQLLRLDTGNASYAATEVATYAVETDAKNNDRVSVFDGTMEVRTPARTTRVREGEEARIDDGGIYDLVNAHSTADEFERWFIQRASRYNTASGRYLDRSLAYSEAELGTSGSWFFAANYGGWCWRPHVAAGWRPYYNGYWRHSPGGVLVWVSYDPWGWVPYHYGRWAYEPAYGWVWLPGAAYAPAWVYWMYGPSYVGWAPMGWYDCYRPYYDWAYRPYARAGFEFGGGWNGSVRPGEVDLRPWTFVTPNQLMNHHVDQASLTADLIRERLHRDGNTGLVSSAPARFTRNEIKDPNAAVGNVFRRGIGSGTGREGSGSATDMTPFFRRDPELSNAIRERVVRARPVEGVGAGVTIPVRAGAPSGVPTPGTTGTLEGRVNRGADGTVPRNGESPIITRDGRPVHADDPAIGLRRGDAPAGAAINGNGTTNEWRRGRAVDGNLRRGDASQTPSADTPRTTTPDRGTVDRNRGNNDNGVRRGDAPAGETTPKAAPGADGWRGRAVGRHDDTGAAPAPSGNSGSSRDVPRRIIDAIGGAHIFRGETPSSDDTPRRESAPRDSGRSTERSPSPQHTERSSPPPSHSEPSHVDRSSPPPSHSEPSHVDRSSPPPQSHDSGSHESHNDGGSKSKKD